MSKVAFTTLLNREDSALSPHFGMAKWILIRDDDNGQITFEQNTALNGRAVVDIMIRHGCTDAVFTQIGPGAFSHLEQAGIRGWIGPADMPVPQLLERLSRGKLVQAQAPESMPMSQQAGRERRGRGPGSGPPVTEPGRGRGCGQREYGRRRGPAGPGCHGQQGGRSA